MKIHHATAKKAEELGITITNTDDGWEAVKDGHAVTAGTPKDALAAFVDMAAEAEAEEEEQEVASSSIVKTRYRELYRSRGDATCCGDEFSGILKEHVTGTNAKGKPSMDMEVMLEVIDDNELTERYEQKWAHLNPGQVRMNAGNMLRARHAKGEPVIVGDTTYQLTEDEAEAAA